MEGPKRRRGLTEQQVGGEREREREDCIGRLSHSSAPTFSLSPWVWGGGKGGGDDAENGNQGDEEKSDRRLSPLNSCVCKDGEGATKEKRRLAVLRSVGAQKRKDFLWGFFCVCIRGRIF